MVFPEETALAIERGQAEHIPLHEAERAIMGFSHCETGRVLAEAWRLPDEMREVIACHHDLDMSAQVAPLVAVVHLCDLLCRVRDMGYGYYESRRVDFMDNPAWNILSEADGKIGKIDWRASLLKWMKRQWMSRFSWTTSSGKKCRARRNYSGRKPGFAALRLISSSASAESAGG